MCLLVMQCTKECNSHLKLAKTILISDGQQMVVVFYDLWFLMTEGIGDVWQLNFKPIGLIVSPHDINIYDHGPICKNIPNNCYFVTSTYETRILDLPMYL